MYQQNKARVRGGDKEIGNFRYRLYRAAINQINRAINSDFYIEAIIICDSMIQDRLEARWQFLTKDYYEDISSRSSGDALKTLKRIEHTQELQSLYDELEYWIRDRNMIAHSFVKVTHGNQYVTLERRQNKAQQTATEGLKLFRKTDRLISNHNKY